MLLPLLAGAAPLVAAHLHAAANDAVVAAIEHAVHARVGRDVSVSVSELSGVRLVGDAATLEATLDPSARIGSAVRFVLMDGAGAGRKRVGEATATVHVTGDAVRVRKPVARGARLSTDDIEFVTTDMSGRPFKPALSMEEAIGARALHDLAADLVLSKADIAAESLVNSGDTVSAHAHVGGVEIIGQLVAAENGVRGDVIRVVNKESGRTLRARVIGSGEVEVVNVR